jgi:hypothetical protein
MFKTPALPRKENELRLWIKAGIINPSADGHAGNHLPETASITTIFGRYDIR